jgi:hypothetical protein
MTMQMPDTGGIEGRASGKRYDRWVERGKEIYTRHKENGVALLLQDGYPPGAEPARPEDQRVQLTSWKITGDVRYANNPRAQRDLARLEAEAAKRVGLQPPDTSQPPPQMGA